jgi:mannose-6-phosphate isomerase-like protein (cupin superfamily)
MTSPAPAHLAAIAQSLPDLWSPRVVAELNGQLLKVAKVQGAFPWHDHGGEDELFVVLKGALTLDFEDRPAVTLGEGHAYVVPKGVRHRPSAADTCLLMLVEPIATKHTGEVVTPLTRSLAEQMGA